MRKVHFALTLVVFVLVASALACNLSAVTAPTPTPTPTAPPTPTAAPSQATPVSAAQPANVLEAQVEAVYDQAGPAVVHITSRVITYDVFMQATPQEGTGSGFVYDTEGHIVTNYHVVADAESVSVALAAGGATRLRLSGRTPPTTWRCCASRQSICPPPSPWGIPTNCGWDSSSSPSATPSAWTAR